jgi:hypothetical protein
VTAPVPASRAILSKNGLHHDLQLIFRVQAPLLNVLLDPASITPDIARSAYQYLTDKWLTDIDTDGEGKAIIIALAMTLIQRHLLSARPAFFVTAGQRGGGKTTLLNMISTAVFGRQAAAANWSASDEERRKAIFSYCSAGVSLLVWDNIPRAEAISCPTIEKALTAEEISDRVLGESRTLTVPATTVMAFTGNNISPKGDLASRSLIVRLSVSRADPENRNFQHPDPIGWTLANRRRILAALYTIMLAPPARHHSRQRLASRISGRLLVNRLSSCQASISRSSLSTAILSTRKRVRSQVFSGSCARLTARGSSPPQISQKN